MKAGEFIREVIQPEYAGSVTMMVWRPSAQVHIVVLMDAEVPHDDDDHTMMLKLYELPGGTPHAVIEAAVKPKYRKNAKLLLLAARRGTFGPMRPNDPVPDDIELGREFEVYLKLGA